MALVWRFWQYGLLDILADVLNNYLNVVKFPGGGPPYEVIYSIPILSTLLTFCWMLLFIISAGLTRGTLLIYRMFGLIVPFLDIDDKPMQVIGWSMLVLFTPTFWIISFLRLVVLSA